MTGTRDLFSAGSLVHSRYRIHSVVGTGGVATVYRATDEQLGREVALKVIPRGEPGSAELRRVEDEVRLIAGFNHPALVTLFDVVAADDASSTLVMQFVDGEDLSARITRSALDSAAVAELGIAVAGALAFVHQAGVIHRDVKPANILLPATGMPAAMLADFGIARLIDSASITATGSIIGTASYLSPEQARGGALDGSTDIYSLGLVLLEALTGTRAFPGTAVESVAARMASDPPIPDGIGHEWTALLRRMLDRTPAERPGATEVEKALSRFGAATPTKLLPAADAATERLAPAAVTERLAPAVATEHLAPVAPTPTTAAPAPRRRKALVAVLVLAAIAALAVAVAVPMTLAGQGDSPAPSSPESSTSQPTVPTTAAELPAIEYPAVDGELGAALVALQQAVGAVDDDDVARSLGEKVLAVTQSAAGADYEGGRTGLDALTAAVNDAELSASDRDAITRAAEDVRKQLDSVIREADKPGKDKPGEDKPGNDKP